MYQVIQATYHKGQLILPNQLPQFVEGQTVQVIIFNPHDVMTLKKERFLNFIAKPRVNLPLNYHFNRAELYER